MAALNEAWRVLGDPTRRRQYDQAQAGPVRVARPASPPTASTNRPAAASDHGADPVTHVVRGAPLLAMLFVLLAIFVITAFAARSARDEPETRGSDGIVEIGSCLALATGQPVVEVPCAEPHDGRAAAIIPLDLSCPVDTEYYVAPGGSARVCVDTEELP
jgi:hypothetical protein